MPDRKVVSHCSSGRGSSDCYHFVSLRFIAVIVLVKQLKLIEFFPIHAIFFTEVMQVHPTAEKFKNAVSEKYDLDVELKEFEEGTKTAADAAEAIGCEVAQIAKSIVMKAGDELAIVITSGVNEVDEEKLAAKMGAGPEEVGPANPDEVKEKLGWGIGGVPPFGHVNDCRTFLDPHLESFDTIWAAAGTPNAVFPIPPEKLNEVANPEQIDL